MWLSAATMTILMLMACPALADSPTTVINAVGNTGNSSGQAAIGTSGNVNQNTNQNSLGSTSATSVNIGVINVHLPGIPGVLGAPGNFSQPYKPDVFINGAGPIRPSSMTYEQAKECRGGYGYKDTYVGGNNRERAKEIKLVYAAW